MAQDKVASTKALEGIRILDIGRIIAGPFAMALLADFGAEVIKVEAPGGDPLRHTPPLYQGHSLLWAVEGRNKKSVTLDLNLSQGREQLLKLASISDVVFENFGPGVMEGWGLDYEAMKKVNPGLILVRISPYGQTGPYKDRPGGDLTAQAMGGMTHFTRYIDGTP